MASDAVRFGHTALPAEQRTALARAKRLEWITIGYMITCVVAVALVMGSSQAMKAAWIEDMLALVPPIAFLIATRQIRKRPSPEYPYGRHRFVASGHLVAATALLLVGGLLVEDSVTSLIAAEHPPIGSIRIFGHTVWAGWAMIAVMVYTLVGPIIIARKKMPLAQQLHDRVLFADADMQKADWTTAAGSIAGVLGIGLGLWWADAAVATLIALSIVHDGWRNLRYALRGLMDGRARTTDENRPHPLVEEIERAVARPGWVRDARSRVRDMGHLLQVEAFVVPEHGTVSARQIDELADSLRALDWKIDDVVIMPVGSIPDGLPDPLAEQD